VVTPGLRPYNSYAGTEPLGDVWRLEKADKVLRAAPTTHPLGWELKSGPAIIQESEEPFAMFSDLKHKYGDWVLDLLKYDTADNLINALEKAVVRPALDKGQELLRRRAEAIGTRSPRLSQHCVACSSALFVPQ
jgi:hypothetical protein